MRRHPAPVPLAAVVAIAVLAACNRGQDPTIDASGTGTTTATATATSTLPAPDSAVPASTPPVSERAQLTAVRVDNKEDGGSRVVFEFDPVVPGYKVDYVTRPITMDGSGDEVRVAGEAVLDVTMENASLARFEGEKVVLTYTGPRRVQPSGGGAGVVVEAVEAGDFEGVVHWVVGLRQKDAEVSVSTLSGPSRLVLDFAPS
ncbi:MAG: hypothetical protein M3P85_03260 [Actinomycetota bacterium]|nr:hypothetical protein [Actinomycetota bacterium]